MQQHNSHRNNDNDSDAIRFSKALSYILRHGAAKERIEMRPDGYVKIADLQKHAKFKNKTVADFQKIVAENDKQRFLMVNENSEWIIKANQGHSVKVDVELEEIVDAAEIPVVVHGTYWKFWESIKRTGLSKMKRNHIHFAVGTPGQLGVISGMRASSEILIYINVPLALADGVKFFRSPNNVILSDGNKEGIIEAKYFAFVESGNGETIISAKEFIKQQQQQQQQITEVSSSVKDEEKIVRGLQKKIKEAKSLKTRQDNGQQLEANQVAKIGRIEEYERELENVRGGERDMRRYGHTRGPGDRVVWQPQHSASKVSQSMSRRVLTSRQLTVESRSRILSPYGGPIMFGNSNIVEEGAVIVNHSDEPLVIGDDNLFEVGSVFEGAAVGSGCVLEPRAHVQRLASLGDNCVVGAAASTWPAEVLADNTVVYAAASNGTLRHAVRPQTPRSREQALTHLKHVEYLKDVLKRFHAQKAGVVQSIGIVS
ncbi:tRNA 2'-phosphotransferase 1 [Physocladia obscura]|uniref:2'-phosphotransferase n=1 Tax=Physocladia obscura TaxID=109957 RepID=A0AAD5XEW4_9FUNG|nr:tRNA 2'-phosphotransferase 1 [Physocladia obscura]